MIGATIGALLAEAVYVLRDRSATPRLDAELLLAHVLGWPRARLIAERDFGLNAEQQTAFGECVAQRAALVPVAYLVGHKEFYGRDFVVDRRVLVPRPETELLVERALDVARGREPGSLRLADIGTGSGCIAVALALELPGAQVQAVDLSRDALAVAQQNVDRYGVRERVRLLHGDLLAPVVGPVDMIISNPPYTVLAEVDEGVLLHEPHVALDGGAGGLEVYERLLPAAGALLAPGGAILLEIGAWQGQELLAMARHVLPGLLGRLHQDLAGRDRVLELVEEARQ